MNPARPVILIHGIGNYHPGWSIRFNLPKLFPQHPVVEFSYEQELEESRWNSLTSPLIHWGLNAASRSIMPEATRLMAKTSDKGIDSVNDILVYFHNRRIRTKIWLKLADLFSKHPNAMIVAHSLGSIVAYEVLKQAKQLKTEELILVTLGSPLGGKKFSPLPRWVKNQLAHCKEKDFSAPTIKAWFNLYGNYDPIAGIIQGLGCLPENQFEIAGTHDLKTYLTSPALQNLV